MDKIQQKSDSEDSDDSSDEEDRLRRLFVSCDRDGDGFIDSQDLQSMCKQLNLEDAAVDDIMVQLGADERGLISWDEFLNCRVQLTNEIEQEKLRQRFLTDDLADLPSNDFLDSMMNLADGGGGGEMVIADMYKMLQVQHPQLLNLLADVSRAWESQGLPNCLHIVNSLHVAALASMKGKSSRASARLCRVSAERDALKKQLGKLQSERLHQQRDWERRWEEQVSRYEERITELHGVIAELRKKLDRSQIGIIREEDEEEEYGDGGASIKNNDDDSVTGDNGPHLTAPPQSNHLTTSLGFQLNDEFDQVVTDIEHAISENTRQLTLEHPPANAIRPAAADLQSRLSAAEEELREAASANAALQQQLVSRDADIAEMRRQAAEARETYEALQRKVQEGQGHGSSGVVHDSSSAVQPGGMSTPRKLIDRLNSSTTSSSTWCNTPGGASDMPIAKVAGLKRLKRYATEKTVSGAEIGSVGLNSGKLVEHLVEDLQQSSSIQEMLRASSLISSSSASASSAPTSASQCQGHEEFELELERRQSRVDSLKAHNDLLALTLDECKRHCEHVSTLLGQYESNCTALSLAAGCADQAFEAYDILTRISTLSSPSAPPPADQRSKLREARQQARQLTAPLRQVQRQGQGQGASDEGLLLQHIEQLLQQRAGVMATVQHLALPAPMFEASQPVPYPTGSMELQRQDLEYSVLLQELMAVKEERAELKVANSQLVRERTELVAKLSDVNASAVASQNSDISARASELLKALNADGLSANHRSPAASLAELQGGDSAVLARDLAETTRRELALKAHLHEVIDTLEQVSHNAEERHRQSADCVDNLKKANAALVTAFEKVKRKYQQKVKKLEEQIQVFVHRYENQVQTLQQRLIALEAERARGLTGETIL